VVVDGGMLLWANRFFRLLPPGSSRLGGREVEVEHESDVEDVREDSSLCCNCCKIQSSHEH